MHVEIGVESLLVAQRVAPPSKRWEVTIAIQYADGGKACTPEPKLWWELLSYIPTKPPTLRLVSLLEDAGEGEVTRRPLDGDEARGVCNQDVRIRAQIDRRRRVRVRRVRRVRSSLRRSSG